jgi:class 3 adenylate cyclase
MDIHRDVGDDVEAIAEGHLKDLEAQDKYGVRYVSYWFNQQGRTVCCLVEAPDAESASKVHVEAHGAAADKLIPVESDVVEAFLGGSIDAGLGRMVGATGSPDGGFRTVLFTDIEDSTGMTQRLGDAAARKVVLTHDELVRHEIEARHGRVLKHTGDGCMATFAASSAAVRAAIKIQQRLAEYNEGAPNQPLRVRIGMSAGEPVDEGDDLFGTAVQLARRVCDAAPAEHIYVPNVVRELCAGKDLRFADVGATMLKGFADPVSIYDVLWISADESE